METKDGREPAPPTRGVLRVELVRDLALGAETHDQLAEKYGRSVDAIHQFSSYNRDEIRRAKQALVADPGDEYAGVAIAKKWYRVADADQDLAHIEDRLADPLLTDTQRKGYLNLKSKLRREVAEERGELPSRIAIESNSPLMTYEIVGVDMAKVFAEHGTAGLGASDAVPAGSSSVSEGHMSRDERVRSYVERKAGPVPESAPSVPASEVPEPSATSPGEVSDPRLKSWLNS
jgi:hypothetical protein